MSLSVSRAVPDLTEQTGDASVEFSINGKCVVVTCRTGYYDDAGDSGSIVILDGTVYADSAKEDVVGEHDTFERENRLRDNRSGLFSWISRKLGSKPNTSFEEFFDEFVIDLGEAADMSIDTVETGDAFERLAQSLIEQGAFSQEKGEGNWKPYVRVWNDRRWLNDVQER